MKKNSELFDNQFKIILVSHVSAVLDYCLIDPKISDKLKVKNITYEKTFNSKDYLD